MGETQVTGSFNIAIPTADGAVEHVLHTGDTLFVVGANGSGKSGLVSMLFNAHSRSAKRISAHRQTWFTSNTLDLTPRGREQLEQNIRSRDQQATSRWRQDFADQRAGAAIYDLIDADNMLARAIADLVRNGNIAEAQNQVKSPSPIAVVNELLRLSNMPIAISVEKQQKIVANRPGSPPYSVAELSDGERNAFLIAADVLTSEPGTLLLIDEPERHLHRSITSPLLSLLFEYRKDCAFIISTHDVTLPADNLSSTTLLVRSCEYDNSQPKYWTCDVLPPDTRIDDELKRDIIGARKKIVFVEGAATSLDATLYSVLFPHVSVIPKSSYRDVEGAVRSLRGVEETHWVQAWGIVDNDRRSDEDVRRLRDGGVHALPYFSVESVYFHPEIIKRVAARQAHVTGDDLDKLYKGAVEGAIEEALQNREHLVSRTVEKMVRQKILTRLPTREQIQNEPKFEVRIDVEELRVAERRDFDSMVASGSLKGLLRRYPLRESGALTRAARELGFSRSKYESAVRKMLRDDMEALEWCRGLFGELVGEIYGTDVAGGSLARPSRSE